MPSRPKVYQLPNGNYNVRVEIPASMWPVAKRVGEIFGNGTKTPELYGLWYLMKRIGHCFEEGDVSWLSDPEIDRVLKELRDGNLGVTPGAAHTIIDLDKLHKNRKMKSGFVGVYTNGNGFRAIGRTLFGGSTVIGTYKTAEEAANRRWHYYKQHGLAYGELEEMMDEWRTNTHKWGTHGYDDAMLLGAIHKHLEDTGTWDAIYGPHTCSMAPANLVGKEKPDRPPQRTELIGFEDGDIPEALR
jgi:hypothetical protein